LGYRKYIILSSICPEKEVAPFIKKEPFRLQLYCGVFDSGYRGQIREKNGRGHMSGGIGGTRTVLARKCLRVMDMEGEKGGQKADFYWLGG
jgi:hypothetical protein